MPQDWASYHSYIPSAHDFTRGTKVELSKQESFHEIIVSEAEYRVQLSVLEDVFLTPLLATEASRNLERINDFAYHNVKAMTAASDDLLADFEQCQLREGPFIKSLGVIIDDFFAEYETVLVEYAAILPHILAAIRDLMEISDEISLLLKDAQQDTRAKQLSWVTYVQLPITHCKRRQFLFQIALNKTIDSTQRREIQAACTRMQNLETQIDQIVDLESRRAQLEDLVRRLVFDDPQVLRKDYDAHDLLRASWNQGLILQSTFNWQSTNRSTDVLVFVTDSILLLAVKSLTPWSKRRRYDSKKVCVN